MPWPRFILAVVSGTLLVSASIFLLGPRVFNLTREVVGDLLPRRCPDVLYAFLVNVPALVVCAVPAGVVTFGLWLVSYWTHVQWFNRSGAELPHIFCGVFDGYWDYTRWRQRGEGEVVCYS